MYQLEKITRDDIIRVLTQILAPASSGYTIIQIVNILSNLKEVEKPKTDVKPTNL